MRRYKDNLKARHIVLSKDDKYMVGSIARRKLNEVEVYSHLSEEIQSILLSNVLIVATTDNIKRRDDKADIIIGNIPEAIKLVMDDVKEGGGTLQE